MRPSYEGFFSGLDSHGAAVVPLSGKAAFSEEETLACLQQYKAAKRDSVSHTLFALRNNANETTGEDDMAGKMAGGRLGEHESGVLVEEGGSGSRTGPVSGREGHDQVLQIEGRGAGAFAAFDLEDLVVDDSHENSDESGEDLSTKGDRRDWMPDEPERTTTTGGAAGSSEGARSSSVIKELRSHRSGYPSVFQSRTDAGLEMDPLEQNAVTRFRFLLTNNKALCATLLSVLEKHRHSYFRLSSANRSALAACVAAAHHAGAASAASSSAAPGSAGASSPARSSNLSPKSGEDSQGAAVVGLLDNPRVMRAAQTLSDTLATAHAAHERRTSGSVGSGEEHTSGGYATPGSSAGGYATPGSSAGGYATPGSSSAGGYATPAGSGSPRPPGAASSSSGGAPGVSLPPAAPASSTPSTASLLSDRAVLRFLHAAKLSPEEALALLERHLNMISRLRVADVPDAEVQKNYARNFCTLAGRDNEGRPMVWIRFRYINPGEIPIPVGVKSTWMSLEAALQDAQSMRVGRDTTFFLGGTQMFLPLSVRLGT